MKIFSLIAFFFSLLATYGQEPQTRLVMADDFFGRNTPPAVYDMEIDADGFVYIIYPGIIWKFNGIDAYKEWKTEDPDDQNYYFALHKGYHEEILLSGPFGVAYIKGDSIIKYPIPDSLAQFGRIGYESVYVDKEGLLHFAPRYRGYYTIDRAGNLEQVVGLPSNVNGFVATHLEDGHPFMYSINSSDNTTEPFSLYSSISNSKFNVISEIDGPIHESSLVQYQNGSIMFSNGNHDMVHFDKNGLIDSYKYEFKVNKLFIDSKDFLWIGTLGEGILKLETPQFEKFEKYHNGNSAVLTESFDHGIWFKSDSAKFGYIPPSDVLNYSPQTGYPMALNIAQISLVGPDILMLRRNGKLLLLNNDNITAFNPPGVSHIEGIPKDKLRASTFCYDRNSNRIWVSYHGELQGWNGNDWKILKLDEKEFDHFSAYEIKAFPNGRVIGSTRHEIFEIIDEEIVVLSKSIDLRILSFVLDASGRIWITAYDGLWILEDGIVRRPFEEMPEEMLTQSIFLESIGNSVWCQPIDAGLLRIKNDSIIPVIDHFGNSVKLYTYCISPSGDLWGCTLNGEHLARIEIKDNELIINYYQFSDLAFDGVYVNGLIVTDTHLFLGGRNGLFKQKISELTNEKNPSKVIVSEIRINHEVSEIKDTFELNYDENFINITFDGISFRRLTLKYSYQMQGLDTVWRETQHKQIQYTNLPSGEYQFKLRVKTRDTDWTAPQITTFIIEKPYWKTWWFRILLILSVLLTIFLIVHFRIRSVRKKAAEKNRIQLELSQHELRTLRAQMNPHFIFNVLKSIQSRILKGGKWEANDLLIRFSKLIRASLEYSKVEFISLDKEIEFIDNYLEIEKQRVPGKFTFEIMVESEDEIDDILIPTLLIQPICENAIKHAFETYGGKLTLNLKMVSSDIIEVHIIDDGIGYTNSKKTNNSAQPSRGLEIVESRLNLFKLQGFDTSIQINTGDKTTGRGTEIILRLPCK
ncbi:MAG: ligand-binding sensor domain-containing protein [Crocinitomix sp.]|jgi:ligand-binding sensor domain-containing protein